MRHLLAIQQLQREDLLMLLDNAQSFVEVGAREIKKVPALRGKTIINLFFEASTRTRSSFEIAGKRLSADVINIGESGSSSSKGETFLDTARTLKAMAPDVLVVRHRESGAAHFLARMLSDTAVVNAGDGMNEHPTQALLDLLTIKQHFAKAGRDLQGLKISIVGDVLHSRVARSNVWAQLLLGNKVRLVGPSTLVPRELISTECFGSENVSIHNDLVSGIEGADIVMCLRLQRERQAHHFIPSTEQYCLEYCVNEKILRKLAPDCVVMHPGPINRGIEVSSEVVDGPRSLVSDQVSAGVAVRMAVLYTLGTRRGEQVEQE